LAETSLEAVALKTNIPPQGPMEGFGMAQGFFASEMHASRIADALHQNPAEWRKSNCLSKNDLLGIGFVIRDNVPITELIESAAAMSAYYRERHSWRKRTG
jgi:xanthine dehydrogenase molybdenum-binding subunit